MADLITPEQSIAAKRYRDDYEFGFCGVLRSFLKVSSVRQGGSDMSDHRLCAVDRVTAANSVMDSNRSPLAAGPAPSAIMKMFLVDDMSFEQIGDHLGGMWAQKTRSTVFSHLVVLTAHYEKVDKENGISDTPHTKEAALKRLAPPEDD